MPIIRLKPVPGASIKTKSLTSSRLQSLLTILYGAPSSCCPSVVTTRLGPNDPICSHIVELPGPPLYKNVTGRTVPGFFLKYAT